MTELRTVQTLIRLFCNSIQVGLLVSKHNYHNVIEIQYLSRVMRKPTFTYAKTKTQISFAVTAKLISAFVFATRIVQSLYLLNTKFQASSYLPGLCGTWSETPKTGFLTTRLIFVQLNLCLFLNSCLTEPLCWALCPAKTQISLVVRKPVFGVSDQVRHKPGCTTTQDG